MNRYTLVIISILISFGLNAQNDTMVTRGQISYITSSHIYVKFDNTSQINPGDTLFMVQNDKQVPGLVVQKKSSISCICSPVEVIDYKVGAELFHRQIMDNQIETVVSENDSDRTLLNSIDSSEQASIDVNLEAALQEPTDQTKLKPSKISGRISASSYTSFKDLEVAPEPRMKYTLSLKGDRVANRNLYLDSYLSFRHQFNHWEEVSDDFNRAFKVYNLSLSYLTEKAEFTFGRKINRDISNIGAVDGAQFAYHFKNLKIGTILGTRPDVYDYGLNFNLPEAGIYLSHFLDTNKGQLRSTLGLFEQRSGRFTDRRFLYLQHTNSAIQNLFIFASCEIDLYKKVENVPENTLSLTSLFLSARYRFSRNYSMYVSFDNRKNVIYYETYKNTIDRLLELETRQGLRVRFVARPFKFGSIGISGTYRYQKNNLSPTKNANIYFNYSRVPLINTAISLSYTYLNTYYLSSNISSIRLRKDLLKGKVGLGMQYRWVLYNYKTSSVPIQNHIAGLNMNIRLGYDINLSMHYEITASESNLYHRNYLKLIKRIR